MLKTLIFVLFAQQEGLVKAGNSLSLDIWLHEEVTFDLDIAFRDVP